MKLFIEVSCLRPLLDESLQGVQLVVGSAFNATRVVKHVTVVALVCDFILNIMFASLWQRVFVILR